MTIPRVSELAAVFLIGDGVVSVGFPRRHSLLWADSGPGWFRRAMVWCARHPTATRLIGATEILLGSMLAARQYRTVSTWRALAARLN